MNAIVVVAFHAVGCLFNWPVVHYLAVTFNNEMIAGRTPVKHLLMIAVYAVGRCRYVAGCRVQNYVVNWSHLYGLNDEICAPVVATVAQFFNLSPMLLGVVMLVTSSSHNSGAIAAGRLADRLVFNAVAMGVGKLACRLADMGVGKLACRLADIGAGKLACRLVFNAAAKAFASRLAVPTVLSTGTPTETALAGGTAHVPVRLLVGPYVMPVRTLFVAGWPVATPGV